MLKNIFLIIQQQMRNRVTLFHVFDPYDLYADTVEENGSSIKYVTQF